MPLITRSGKTVSLVRPQAVPPERVVPKKQYGDGNLIQRSLIDLPKYEHFRSHQTPSKYPRPKVEISPGLPALVCLTFRYYAINQKLNLSDAVTDIVIHYLDDKFPGWDTLIPSRDEDIDLLVEQQKKHRWKRKTTKINGIKNLDKSRNLKSHFKGIPRIPESFSVPRSVYIAIQSVAVALDRPMSDVVIEAMMFFFDEMIPGWEMNGDDPCVPSNP